MAKIHVSSRLNPIFRVMIWGCAALACLSAAATTFTDNTAIGVGNTNYDGIDIVISNCTVTVDGPHAFASLLVAGGGVLTHSFYPGGMISNLLFITNESQVLHGTNPVTLLDSNVITATVLVTDPTGTIDYTNDVDYSLIADGILTELERTTNSSIADGAEVLVSYESLISAVPAGLDLSITGNVEVAVGGAISAVGNGYGGGMGTGAGRSAGSVQDGSGAGYGGIGGTSSSNALGGGTYGSFTQPANLGSGGGASYAGPGGAGGGMIEIAAGGSAIIDGSISANGANGINSRSGGGSGGSVWITAQTLSGSGAITANGGAGEPTHGGGGGGGRIAFQYGATAFTGSMTAYGGAGAQAGGAGTVYTALTGQNGLLVIDNGGQMGANTSVAVANSAVNVLIQGNAGVLQSGNWTVGNLTVSSNGLLLASSTTAINLTSAGAIRIQAGGALIADSAGSTAGTGSGAGSVYIGGPDFPCGGGGYGGSGANGFTNAISGAPYGSQATPNSPGSGGGTYPPYSIGGAGGGVIQITSLSGIVQVDGRISANGGNGSGTGGGGGSGGSIWLTGGTLLGSGSITANGGNGINAIGGGGGGRIALAPTANLFGGTISAYGGGGANWGGAGTVLFQVSGQNAQLILDNDGHAGTNTLVQTAGATDLIVRGGAIGSASSTVTFANLYLNTSSRLAPAFYSGGAYSLNFTFTGNATIQPGTGIVADFAGSLAGVGTGAGHYNYYLSNYCSGAGHGGIGGNSFGNYALGGTTYDSVTAPIDPGSGGGTYDGLSLGGVGGGVIRLSVTGTLEVDGIISANGGSGSGFSGGGGSGGSIWITAGALSGGGLVEANGGNGAVTTGGGGGGGIVAVFPTTNLFAGTISAYGGGGANWGGAGMTFVGANTASGQFIVDNGGNSGAATPIPSVSSFAELILRNGAVGYPQSSSQEFGNLLVGSNSWLIASPVAGNSYPGVVNLTLTGNATIQAGGGIVTDSAGSAAGEGTGAGHYYLPENSSYPCSGAGYGGYGGFGSAGSSAAAGVAYGSSVSPTGNGSGGGSYSTYSFGGAGGGSIRLTITGALDNEGRISASGGNGGGYGGGGGSGGSVWLTVGTLAGGGSITANGGNGVDSQGGGGGGGRISVSYTTYSYTGSISAYGGGGAGWGGAGTVYLAPKTLIGIGPSGYPQLTLDNGGHIGTGTIFDSTTVNLLVTGGAIGVWPSGSTTVESLEVGSNSVLTTVTSASSQTVNVSGNASIDAGGALSADGTGNAVASGPGAGGASSAGLHGGGGHGGFGAANPPGYGGAYGSIQSPVTAGSGGAEGGGGFALLLYGGAGGGALRLAVTGTLAINGRVSSAGMDGELNSGGGAGGSLFVSASTLTGAGVLSANGGAGNGSGGGGGGGRISLAYTSDSFVGLITAAGGNGYARGGAGTIYTKANNQSVGQLLVDNGGMAGTNTPVSIAFGIPAQPFNLTIQNGAVAGSATTFPVLSNLTVAAGGVLTSFSALSILDLVVLQNVDVTSNGVIALDEEGFSQANGPGAGQSSGGFGSGAGQGGSGGASASAPGGVSYGSAQQPVDFGSGGGLGSGPVYAGSEGGGALRLSVGGVLTVNGQISAEGAPGLQDESGGGSGGSLWVSAGTLTGVGRFAADGGAGVPYGGGGGAGGRIALYSKANLFSGVTSVSGAAGDFPGANGTVFTSNNVAPLQVISNSPSGLVSNGVSFVDLYFDAAPNPSTFAGSDITLTTPGGPLAPGSISVSMLSSAHYRATFPLQTANGNYAITVGTNISDLYGQLMAQAYTGGFAISLPVVQGTILNTNGQPVAGVLLQPTGGFSTTTTDTNGNYALGFVPGSSFTVTPSQGTLMFVPSSMSYTNLSASISNQNYLAVSTIAPTLTAGGNATNFGLGWQPIPGVTYQVYCSTNLTTWVPYGASISGSNGPVQIPVPTAGNPTMFFRVQSSD